jgi:hypothetical protein
MIVSPSASLFLESIYTGEKKSQCPISFRRYFPYYRQTLLIACCWGSHRQYLNQQGRMVSVEATLPWKILSRLCFTLSSPSFSLRIFSVRLRRNEDKMSRPTLMIIHSNICLSSWQNVRSLYPSFTTIISIRHFSPSHLKRRAYECCSHRHQLDTASIQACLDSILKAEIVLHCIVSDLNFIHGTSKQKAGQIKICETVMSESFICNLRKSLKILEPIDKLITMFQSDCTALSDVLKHFAALGPTLSTLEGLHADEKEYLTKLTKYRFEFIYGDAHGIAYVLDPRYIDDRLSLNIRDGIEETIVMHC